MRYRRSWASLSDVDSETSYWKLDVGAARAEGAPPHASLPPQQETIQTVREEATSPSQNAGLSPEEAAHHELIQHQLEAMATAMPPPDAGEETMDFERPLTTTVQGTKEHRALVQDQLARLSQLHVQYYSTLLYQYPSDLFVASYAAYRTYWGDVARYRIGDYGYGQPSWIAGAAGWTEEWTQP
ncbi:hypothetical protein ACN47E_005806 [Coniothyrium glycines]